MADDVCRADSKAIAKELDAGVQSSVELRPCLNSTLPANPRYKLHLDEMNAAKAAGDREGIFKAYEKMYSEVLGPAQTKFWDSVNQQLSPEGLCHLELVWSKEYPNIAEHVEIKCKEDSRPVGLNLPGEQLD